MVRAGILRHRVNIEAHDTGTDEWGQPVDTWTPVVTSLPAEIRDIRGREFWSSGQAPAGEVTVRVRIRYREDLKRQMRVKHIDEVLLIEAIIDPDGRRTELHLMCRRVD